MGNNIYTSGNLMVIYNAFNDSNAYFSIIKVDIVSYAKIFWIVHVKIIIILSGIHIS